eukprot:4190521-Heterocapsa_arctica.AAC.1
MRCAGPSRYAAPAVAVSNAGEWRAPTLMGSGAASSSHVDPAATSYTPEQVAAAEIRNKAPYTPSADVNAALRTVLLYRWSFDNNKSHADYLNY